MRNILYVGLGGCIGASLRYILSANSSKLFSSALPIGTLMVNVLGGILMGFIMEWSLNSHSISQSLELFLTTGILGGLTTFSTFSYETITLFSGANYILATLNILLNLFLSLIGVVVGKGIFQMIGGLL
ncbi:fluoride efflux transporter CrcB [Garciella nitratireducens]|uniref:Fluoride-specific ion channel FluC n=1 Tax=Garciella nitratireducens DSM 15102 TaxID=1121911 RepID=A0A1T4NHM2_9FIRM|nr:fluoride efflux transporter CrcB [Garciella nitratireducens]RBP42859.1 camphor resistance protein CrcB [Garciella nitratireducens]SJZ78566.1 camphor resistance protein CrcB [Garciella nitratireducens DSM 15102]